MKMLYAISLIVLVVAVESKSLFPIGGNLAGAVDYNPTAMFVNHLYNMRPMGSANAPWDGAGMTYDQYGNPMQDFGLYLLGCTTEPQEYIGNWTISFTGTGTIRCHNGPSIPYQEYNATTNKVSAIMTVSKGQWVFWCEVRGTTGTTTDIKWIRPGYDINNYPTFTKSYLAQYSGWNTFRFMDWFSTNGSPVNKWSMRPSDKDVQSIRGVPYEYAIELCNVLNTNAWINVPSNATDDYVVQMAQLFKAKLNPNLILHVEYSNELWNFIFIQSHWNMAFAEQEIANNATSDLNWDGVGINYYWGYRRQFTRAAEISDIFRSVYGDCAMGKTVRVTAASQFTFSGLYDGGLDTVNRNYGSPDHYFSHCSGAPYFDLGQYYNSDTVTVDQLIDEFKVTSQSYNNTYIANIAHCRYYNLEFVSYEGGPATYPATQHGYTVAGSAIMDPRFQPVVEDFLDTWYSYGNGMFLYYMFGVGGQVSQYGAWDIAADPFNYTASPKWRAVENIRDNYVIQEPSTIGHMLPSNNVGFTSAFKIDDGRGYKVLINSPTTFGANYTIESFNVSCWQSFPTEIWVNNKIVLNLTAGVPCYGVEQTWNASVTFAVPPGENVILFNDKRILSAKIIVNSTASARVYPVKEPIFYDYDPCVPQPPAASTTTTTTSAASMSTSSTSTASVSSTSATSTSASSTASAGSTASVRMTTGATSPELTATTGEVSSGVMIAFSLISIACSILVL